MQKETNQKPEEITSLQAIRVARQVRAIKQAVLHNVDHGITDIPAHGIVHVPGKNYRLLRGTLDRLNKKLEEYEVRVDAYKMNIRGKLVDRVVVTHLDNKLVEPTPAYQSALQSRYLSAA